MVSSTRAMHSIADLRNIRNFLLDLDGTLYIGKRMIAGTPDFLEALRRTGRRHLFMTNNSAISTGDYCCKLRDIGIDATEEEVFSSGKATIGYLSAQGWNRIYLLATPGVEKEFQQAGFVFSEDDAQAVVLTFDQTITYEKIRTASRLLCQGKPFIATHPDKVCLTGAAPLPDCGAMISMLRTATGREPVIVGKPSVYIAEAALGLLGGLPENTAMVGDRLYTDMKLAENAGMTGVLVLSGETSRDAAERYPWKRMSVFESVAELAQTLYDAPLEEPVGVEQLQLAI